MSIDQQSQSGLTVLVVEDEALIRADIADSLADAGMTVLEAADADEAIRILESRTDIRIVFTDVNMPGSMDGLRLAAFVRDRWPPVQLIVTSGHVAVRNEDLPAGARFLRKPYGAPEIIRTMTEMTRGA